MQILWNLLVSVLLLMALLAIAGGCLLALRLLVGSGRSGDTGLARGRQTKRP